MRHLLGWVLTNVCGVVSRLAAAVRQSFTASVAVVDAALSAVVVPTATETELAAALSVRTGLGCAALTIAEHSVGAFLSAIAPVAVADAALSAVAVPTATETELAAALSARAGLGIAAISLGQGHPDQGAHEDEPRENRSRLVHCRHG